MGRRGAEGSEPASEPEGARVKESKCLCFCARKKIKYLLFPVQAAEMI